MICHAWVEEQELPCGEVGVTQAEIIWTLLSIIQIAVIGFVTYWTRRVQYLEKLIADTNTSIAETMEMRTKLLIEYQGRVSKLEAQFTAIMETLVRIERRLDRQEED